MPSREGDQITVTHLVGGGSVASYVDEYAQVWLHKHPEHSDSVEAILADRQVSFGLRAGVLCLNRVERWYDRGDRCVREEKGHA